MVLWFRYYVRRYLRPWMRPIEELRAQRAHKRLTLLYIFLSWNCLGLSYYVYRKAQDDRLLEFKDKSDG